MFGPIKTLGFLARQAFDALAHVSPPAADRLWAETTCLAEIARNTADLRHLVEDTRTPIDFSADVKSLPDGSISITGAGLQLVLSGNLINASAAPPTTPGPAAAAEGPAPVPGARLGTGAGHQTLTPDDLMDAARAVHAFAHQSRLLPAARPYWESLGARIENAAIAAAK